MASQSNIAGFPAIPPSSIRSLFSKPEILAHVLAFLDAFTLTQPGPYREPGTTHGSPLGPGCPSLSTSASTQRLQSHHLKLGVPSVIGTAPVFTQALLVTIPWHRSTHSAKLHVQTLDLAAVAPGATARPVLGSLTDMPVDTRAPVMVNPGAFLATISPDLLALERFDIDASVWAATEWPVLSAVYGLVVRLLPRDETGTFTLEILIVLVFDEHSGRRNLESWFLDTGKHYVRDEGAAPLLHRLKSAGCLFLIAAVLDENSTSEFRADNLRMTDLQILLFAERFVQRIPQLSRLCVVVDRDHLEALESDYNTLSIAASMWIDTVEFIGAPQVGLIRALTEPAPPPFATKHGCAAKGKAVVVADMRRVDVLDDLKWVPGRVVSLL
ncbi:hypothetical protein M427DRAFT_39580 [Gonapodya prolifera JEL478]|uniref:Uncharacterized protein n=1 Tax=Gonapodya prolifera (strain JEL478) TaxID=1344416 RepID=A0A138ZX64_GONPJ|nr:hypothetical protein M427DRAFT_39580 [Gonapodya prolifera JEL478]|eukprot:KXS09099.1 hypothetical protein M427DRAFT_39580 [Gonapodya prolifera JEL478]